MVLSALHIQAAYVLYVRRAPFPGSARTMRSIGAGIFGTPSRNPPAGHMPMSISATHSARRGARGARVCRVVVLCPVPTIARTHCPSSRRASRQSRMQSRRTHEKSPRRFKFPPTPPNNSKTKNPTQMCPATSAARLRFYRFVFCFVSFPVPRRWMAPVSPHRIFSKTADALSKLIAIIQSDVFNPRKKFRLASQPLLPPRGSRCPFPASSSCRVGGTRRCSRGARELCPANRG